MRLTAAVVLCFVLLGHARAAESAIGRLGTEVVPLSESIALDVDPSRPDYTGSADIVIDVRSPVRSFHFHAEAIDLKKLELRGEGRAVPLSARSLPDGRVEVSASTAIPAGRRTLHVEFHNDFDREAKGLYRLRAGDDWYAFTQFEAIDAREAFPCWDEPAFKIPFRISLTVPEADAAIANTAEESAVEKDGKRTVVFKTTRPLPSYLLAVAVGPLEFVPVPGTSVPTRVVTVKGQSSLAGQAVAMTPPILAALERWFGSPYPYDKLDLLAVPEYWYGAMENPGAITFRDNILLIDPASVSGGDREHLAVTTAHELAHMWFGDLVTMAWWDDLWLNESFASWMEHKITAEVFPEFHSMNGRVSSVLRVMGSDSLVATRAMRQPVASMDSLLQSADGLAYVKGSAVLHMVESWVGPEKFRAGVLAYLAAHRDANATASDLWSALGKASGADVDATLSSFLDQPGVPLVTVEPLAGGRARLTQSRFLNAGATASGKQLWRIPVTLLYPDGAGTATRKVLLAKREQVVKLNAKATPAWVHPDAGALGYYRWSLPRDAFARLTAAAGETLDARERIGILGNAAALLDAGLLEGASYVEVLETFASDPDPQVVGNVLQGLGKTRQTFFSGGREADFAPFVRRVLAPAFQRLGLARHPGEPEPVTALRPRLLETLGDAGRDAGVLSEMERLARAAIADPAAVDPSLADVAIRLSAIRGEAALFDDYRERFEKARIPSERGRFLAALGNFRDPALAKRALDYVFAGPLRPQEVMAIPRMQSEVPQDRDRTFAWMTSHYDEIAKRLPADFMVFLPYLAAGCSPGLADEAKRFFSDPLHAPPGTAKELARVEESVGACVSLDAREGASVRRYVASRAEAGTVSGANRGTRE